MRNISMSMFEKLMGFIHAHETPPEVPKRSGRVIDRVLVGEALVIGTHPGTETPDLQHVAHIDLLMGPRGSAAERAFTRTLTCQRKGVNGLLAVAAPNMIAKPSTVMFNKVTIENGKQAVMMFGPAQRGVSMAVMDSVAEGIIPENEADDVFICVGVFINHFASDARRIQDWNYEATKIAIRRAVAREPKAADVLARYRDPSVIHPFAVH